MIQRWHGHDEGPSTPPRPFSRQRHDVNSLAQVGRWAGIGQTVTTAFAEMVDQLAAIQGRCVMAARMESPSPSDLAETAELATRTATVLRDVMAFARGDDGRWTCQLGGVYDATARHFALHRQGDTPVRFETACSTRVACPPAQLQQALQSLISYILEFVGESPGLVDVRSSVHAKEVTITISHKGPGIPDALRTQMFEPFASPATAETGLSLFIARAIVHSHGGFLGFFSTPERGTTFHVVLPLVRDS